MLVGKLNGSSGGMQVGVGTDIDFIPGHAWLIPGNALAAIDLNPPAFYSQATSISEDGAQQCGFGYSAGTGMRPLMWSGSAASVLDLGPLSGFSSARRWMLASLGVVSRWCRPEIRTNDREYLSADLPLDWHLVLWNQRGADRWA